MTATGRRRIGFLALAAAAGLAVAAAVVLDWRRPGIGPFSAAAAFRDSLARDLDAANTMEQVQAAFAAHRLISETWPAAEYARTWHLDRPPPETATVIFGRSERIATGKRRPARFEAAVFVGPDGNVLGHRTRVHFPG